MTVSNCTPFRSHRQNQASPRLELFKQGWRCRLSRHREQDLVERGVLRPATRPVSDTNADVGRAEALQESLGMACEFLNNFDAPDLPGEVRKDCGLVAQAGADLEHCLVRLGSKEIGGDRSPLCPSR